MKGSTKNQFFFFTAFTSTNGAKIDFSLYKYRYPPIKYSNTLIMSCNT